ncbi:NADPH:quinone oxidoreductase family protein [Reichenbachiella agariperforans]|uniref:NADPH:quinone oxidoreductase family protein n=1 Tax=Reichenbachiella agariperforans TaxID=156994 RepID=UPI001C094418|nr:NADPH:quinone oxidoreductase family protein [Reichenbachiella agariperforans]MBU2914909.1 NADPH:quinone oxidoreductase family protein [Reichenbachiella agariperforans]
MKAVLCSTHGGAELLKLEEVPSPVPEANEVIISVKACGLNFPDNLIIRGKYQFQPDFPFSPGGEVSGLVKSVGAKVTSLQVGDRVMAGTSWGGLAEEVRSLATNAFKIPKEMAFESAAASLMTYGTSYHALFDRAQLQPGETVLVLGAAGGIGVSAIQLAKLHGATVIACASTDEKLELCKAVGADHVINYTSTDIKATVKEITKGTGVDVVVDPVGGDFAEPAFRSIARFGRYLVVGFAAGEIPKLPLNLPLLKSASIVGVFWGSFFRNNPERNAQNVDQLIKWFASGQLKPVIDRVFELKDYEQALNLLRDKVVKGKIVLVT